MDRDLPITQYVDRPGVLDLSWGHPCPLLLPTESWRTAAQTALTTYGWQALAYGHEAGPGPLREWIASHLVDIDQRGGDPSEVFVTGGASHALALAAAVLAEPGDVVLVDSPTYYLAFRTLLDRGVELVPAATDADGPDPVAIDESIATYRRRGRRVPLLYMVPTFGNPTGRSLPDRRRRELVELAQRTGLTIVEDDTYRELGYDGATPPSLWSLTGGESVVRLGSFSKTVAPGLRLGWINATREFVGRVSRLGYVHSGGGVNHTMALAMATFGASGEYRNHVSTVRRGYAARRDALAEALRAATPSLEVPTPAGGWFLWLRLPPGVRAATLLPIAERHGMSFMEGDKFYAGAIAGHDHIRLSFSLLTPPELAEAAGRLSSAVRDCTTAS
jgi:DNA-binding transcriptional MocR family regulator